MRQPIRFDPSERDSARYTRFPVAVPRQSPPRRAPRRAPVRNARMTDSTAVRGILALVALILIAVLAYLLTLSSQPTFSSIAPAPNSEAAPGMVTIRANVNAAHAIQEVRLEVDGQRVSPAVSTSSDRDWKIRYQAVLPRGSHTALVTVVDVNQKVQQHSWTFTAAGPRVSPEVTFRGPDPGAAFPQGLIRVAARVSSEAAIVSGVMKINGQEFPVTMTPITVPATEANAPARQIWEFGGERSFSGGTYVVELTATTEHGDQGSGTWLFRVVDDPAKATARYFSTNRVYLYGPFKSFWEKHDGARLFGSPISPRFENSDGLSVQYFERARFELAKDGSVQLGRLGSEAFKGASSRIERPANLNGLYFPETGHTLTGKFKDFWEKNGGLPIFGFPITEVIDEDGTRVQYFERARLELAGNNGDATVVEITPLGTQIWSTKNRNP